MSPTRRRALERQVRIVSRVLGQAVIKLQQVSEQLRSLKSESLSRMIFFGKRSLERAVAEYVEHYHVERNHHGLENELIEPGEATGSENGTIDCREPSAAGGHQALREP